MQAAVTVKTLLGHKNLQFSIDCLKSFLDNSDNCIFLEIFEDGTLTDSDKDVLYKQLNNIVIVLKKERDIKLQSLLSAHPLCYEYRNSIPYAQKIFDVMLYDDKDLLFIDSDIFFMRRFRLPKFNGVPVFIRDTEHAYSFTPTEFLKINYPIYPRVNSGFFYYPNSLFSLDFIEELLRDNVIRQGYIRRNPWLEQAIWSFLAARTKTVFFFEKDEIVMAEKKLKTDERTIAVHLVSTHRNHFPALQKEVESGNRLSNVVGINLKKGEKFLAKGDFAFQKLVKRAKRELKMS